MADDLTGAFLAMAWLAKNAALKSDVATSWWGTVAAVSGDTVSVILESDTSLSAREVTVNAAGPCVVGDEVLLQMQGRDLTIVANPSAQTLPAPRRMRKPDSQTVPTATNTTIVGWASATGDPGNTTGGINYSAGLLTVPVAGAYLVTASMRWASNSSGERQLQVWHNGTQSETLVVPATSIPRGAGTVSVVIPCAAGDTLGISARQTSGSDLAFGDSSSREVWLTIACLGRL